MQRNVGETERAVRGAVGVWLVVVGVAAARTGKRTAALTAGLAGLGLLQNAATGFCGGNWLFGVDTTADG
jgi:hypothetical protein